jgi:hypothetical protein
MTGPIPQTTRELHSRVNDGIRVRMLWHQHDGRVTVAVSDSKTGDAFAVEVRDGERPMDVFDHPYAYAAWHGIGMSASVALPTQAPDRLAA